MNCYCSNLIEGHETHPIDIERALKKDYSADPKQRNLQLEAEAHVSARDGSMGADSKAGRRPSKPSLKSTVGSVSCCRNSCGS